MQCMLSAKTAASPQLYYCAGTLRTYVNVAYDEAVEGEDKAKPDDVEGSLAKYLDHGVHMSGP